MKPSLLLLPLLLPLSLSAQHAAAQSKVVVDRQDKNVAFAIQDKSYPGIQTVRLNLSDLENCAATMGETTYAVRRDGEIFLTLRPLDAANHIGYGYSYSVIDGCINPKIDTTRLYLMPTSPQKAAQVSYGYNVLDHAKKRRERLGYHFSLERGDTVYAMRRGIVVEVEQPKQHAAPGTKVSFSTQSTKISVEHPDGSMARYICLDGDNMLVKEGDWVLPAQPLALVGTYDGEEYKCSVQLMWLALSADRTKFSYRHFFPPLSTTDGNLKPDTGMSYTPLRTRELLTGELTKKEIKQFFGNKK